MAFSDGLDLNILKRVSQDKLIRLLEESPGQKDFIIDNDLMKLIDRIADAKILRNHGVNKIFRLERIPPAASCDQFIYFIRPTLINVKYIVDHVQNLKMEDTTKHKYHLICVPRIISSVSQLLEEEGLYGVLLVHEFCPDFISLDDDLLSLEMNSFFGDAFLDGDFSGCIPIARALATLQSLYGPFVKVIAHGRAAPAVYEALKKICDDQTRDKLGTSVSSKIGHLLIFDRDADYVSPLLTQLTYEGSLDEHYEIRAGLVEFPPEVTGQEQTLKVVLNSHDSIFDNIRNKHFAGVSSTLVRRAKDLQERKESATSMTAAEMKDFVSNDLKALQSIQKSLSLHLAACEGITKNTRKDFDSQLITEHGLINGATSCSEAKQYIEDCIARQLPSTVSLRLLCLYSITQQGISKREYESLVGQFLSAYGYHHLATFSRLKRLGMLLLADGTVDIESTEGKQKVILRNVVSSLGVRKTGNWNSLTKKLHLIPNQDEKIDLHNPVHTSYIYNGAYSPLIPQLTSECLTKSFNLLSDVLKLLPGTTLSSPINDSSNGSDVPRVALVLLLGGVTYGEVAALRLLAVTLRIKIIVAATSTVTGNALVNSTFLHNYS